MNEQGHHQTADVLGQPHTDVAALIKKMQQQLDSLERKIDTLCNQSREKTFGDRPFRDKRFSKPFRSFGHSHHGKKGHGHSFKEREFDQRGHLEKRQDQNFRERDSDQERRFNKPHHDQNRGFDQKRKPFFPRRKNRE